jgi:hypothetical protein
MADLENVTCMLERQRQHCQDLNMDKDGNHTITGTSLIDGSTYIRIFPNWKALENWLTTFEATQYTFV